MIGRNLMCLFPTRIADRGALERLGMAQAVGQPAADILRWPPHASARIQRWVQSWLVGIVGDICRRASRLSRSFGTTRTSFEETATRPWQ